MNIKDRLREVTIRHFNKYSSRMTTEEVIQISNVMGKVIVRIIDEDEAKLNENRR